MAINMRETGSNQGGGTSLDVCFNPKTLQACRPSAKKGITIIRIIPEIGPDGEIVPMCVSKNAGGYLMSNGIQETLSIGMGDKHRHTGFSRAGDRDEQREFDMVFPAMFIRLRSQQKKGKLPPHLSEKIGQMLTKDDNGNAQIGQSKQFCLMQGIALRYNDEQLPKPRSRQAIFLTKTAAEAVSEVLEKAYEEGIDVFSPTEGRAIILTPEAQRGSGIMMFNATLGDKVPLKEEVCRKLWIPWDNAMKLQTFSAQLADAVRCYGREIVEEVFDPGEVRAACVEHGLEVPPVATTESAPAKAAAAPEEAPEIDVPVETPAEEAPADTSAPAELEVSTDFPDEPSLDGEGEAAPAESKPEASAPSQAQAATDYEALLGDL